MQIKGSKALITGEGAVSVRPRRAASLQPVPPSRCSISPHHTEPRSRSKSAATSWSPTSRSPAAVTAAIDAAADAMGGIHLCLNAAGIAPAHRVVTRTGEMFPLDLYEKVLRVNLIGTFDVTRNVARRMTENKPNDDGERGRSSTWPRSPPPRDRSGRRRTRPRRAESLR